MRKSIVFMLLIVMLIGVTAGYTKVVDKDRYKIDFSWGMFVAGEFVKFQANGWSSHQRVESANNKVHYRSHIMWEGDGEGYSTGNTYTCSYNSHFVDSYHWSTDPFYYSPRIYTSKVLVKVHCIDTGEDHWIQGTFHRTYNAKGEMVGERWIWY